MKKAFCIIISIIIIISLCSLCVLADGIPVFSLSNETAAIGEEVSVRLSVSDNCGIAAFKFIIRFNPVALEPVSVVEMNDVFDGFQSNIRNANAVLSECDKVTIVWVNTDGYFGDGDLFEIKFKVKDTAFQNVVLKLDYSPKNSLSSEFEKIEFETIDGSIEVSDGAENDEASNEFEEYVETTQQTSEPTNYFGNSYTFEQGKEYAEAQARAQAEAEAQAQAQAEAQAQANQNQSQNTQEANNNTQGTTQTNTQTDTSKQQDTNKTDQNNTANKNDDNNKTEQDTPKTQDTEQTQPQGKADENKPSASDDTKDADEKQATIYFSDIAYHWAKNYIRPMTNKGIFKGYEDGTFRPNIGLTRQEMAVSVVRLLKLEGEMDKVDMEKFTDDSKIASWAKGYVYLLVSKGIFKGYDDGSFDPNGVITREQLALVLSRSLAKTPENLSEIRFNDVHKISDWSKEAIKVMLTLKIVNGYEDQTFRPQKTVTRAEACTMMYKFLTNR